MHLLHFTMKSSMLVNDKQACSYNIFNILINNLNKNKGSFICHAIYKRFINIRC